MGNCFRSPAQAPVSNHTAPSTAGYSTNFTPSLGVSGTSSGAGISQSSDTLSIKIKDPNSNGFSSTLKVFTLSELKAATKDFKPDTFLGQGGFGKVYKGYVDEKTLAPSKSATAMVVAIKRLNSESVQGFREWQAEVNFLGRLSHPNLVKLLGYCREAEELLLVYEFMQKGSLENHLFRRNPSIEPLSWENRLKIAVGAAKGLAFLHTSEKQVIYRDFKASNILLDLNYNAKISDFGLAKLGPAGEETHVTTRIMGTQGYFAPEYVTTGHLYVQSDVYGFGIVLLELMTGLRALDSNRPSNQRNLADWLSPVLIARKKIKTIMDKRIEGQYSSKAASLVADLIVKCLESDHRNRPSMKDVAEALEQIEIKERTKLKKEAKLIAPARSRAIAMH